jgi:hypothetical protein
VGDARKVAQRGRCLRAVSSRRLASVLRRPVRASSRRTIRVRTESSPPCGWSRQSPPSGASSLSTAADTIVVGRVSDECVVPGPMVSTMTKRPAWPPMDGPAWQRRIDDAAFVRERWALPPGEVEDDEQAKRWLASIDPTAYVGSRHHTVPRFLLQRWADGKDQVRIYRRIEKRHGVENIANLAIRDFYTVINEDGTKSSALESLMGHIEANAKTHLDKISDPFTRPTPLGMEAIVALAQFAAFQSTRTTRRRRELELHAEWYAKTIAASRVADDELRRLSVVPHQNETATMAAQLAGELMPYFMCRPLAVVTLDRPLLYTCDEPVVLNAPNGAFHLADCALTDAEIEQRVRRQLRKLKKRKRGRAEVRGRTVHFSSTMPTGHGVADEILLAISPRSALLWGPLTKAPRQEEPVERVSLDESEATQFAQMANDAMCAQALDWIISRTDDEAFGSKNFPPPGPLMRVCDGTNAAAAAVNEPPHRFRPHRLWAPKR